jgi:CheY-like chemotaxis protein
MASLAVTNALYFEAREANRLKDEFLATLSHELRTPLTAILGWTWLLRSGNPDPAAHAEAMEIIERNARAQAKLIDDMLDISRIISGKLRLAQIPVQIQSQVEAAVDAVRPVAHAKSLHLSLAIDRGLPGVIGDPDRLHQVVSNLLSNAIKFTPEGGRIQVRLDGDAGRVRLSVSDTGIGIAPSFLPFVFERFLQAEGGGTRPQGGLGLGLAIVRHLVELHGGSVQAQSKGEGEGSTFVVDLPAAPIAAVGGSLLPALHLVEPQVSEPPTIAGLHVLVVDDDTDSRATIAMVLRQSAAEVVEASSAAEGMALLQKAKDSDDFDVLVSDIAMPEEDGCSFIRRVRQSNGWSAETLPAIAVSAFVRDEDRARAFSAGFQVHLPKPVMPGQLLAAIAGLVAPPARRRRSLSPDTAP